MTDIEKLAQVLKNFKNPVKVGIVIGKVVEAPPEDVKTVMSVDFMETTFTIKDFYSLCGSSFEKGDKIALLFSDDNNTVYAIGKPIFIGGDDE